MMRPDRQGGIEAYIPGGDEPDAPPGQWVRAHATEQEGVITLSCDPTEDGFRAVFVATIQQYNEAWQAGEYQQTADCRLPRCCGPCKSNPKNINFTIRTTDDYLYVDTERQSYQFKHDAVYGSEDVMAQMVMLVTRHMDSQNITVMLDASFFDVLKQAIEEAMGAEAMETVAARN
jgi:hypothetical protein